MIKYNSRKRLKKKQTNLHQSNTNNYPPFTTLSSYFSPSRNITKTPTPSSILIKQIKNNSNSIRLRLKKKKQKVKPQSHQHNTGNTSQLVLRKIKGHSSNRISSFNEIDNKSIENKSDSSSSYCLSSNSELSES